MKKSRKKDPTLVLAESLAPANEERWQVIGIAAMDTAELVIADPCYLHWEGDPGEGVFQDKRERYLREVMPTGDGRAPLFAQQLNFTKGHPGAGVAIHSPHGDGTVTVYGKVDSLGRVRSVFFSFDGEKPK